MLELGFNIKQLVIRNYEFKTKIQGEEYGIEGAGKREEGKQRKFIMSQTWKSDSSSVIQKQVAQNGMFCHERIYMNFDNHTKQNVIKWYILPNKLMGCLASETSRNMATFFCPKPYLVVFSPLGFMEARYVSLIMNSECCYL